MWPVSERFRAAVRGSHQSVVSAEVYYEDALVSVVYPNAGRVSIDSRRAVRRTLSLDLTDEDGSLVPGPGGTTGVLSPFGSEIRVFRGVRYTDGTEEIVPLGVFVITEVNVSDDTNGRKITVTGSDRSIRIQRARLTDPYQIASGTAVETVIADLLRSRWADVPVDFPATGATVGARVLGAGADSDPWKSAVEIAEAAGFDLAFDADGVVRMRAIPDPTETDPDETYEDGTDAVLLDVARGFDTSTTYNGVIASSEASDVDTPVRAEAWDDDPNSPTYRYGAFGQVPKFYVSSFIRTADMAATAAASQLQRELGRTEAVEWSQIVNPAHDVLDVVRLSRPVLQLDAVLLIDRLEVPLDSRGQMKAVARVREVD
jgi:hypothetical protein